jgi:hypothetical protein
MNKTELYRKEQRISAWEEKNLGKKADYLEKPWQTTLEQYSKEEPVITLEELELYYN